MVRSTSDEPVAVACAQRNTKWLSFKKCNQFKQLKKKLNIHHHLNLDDTNKIKEKGTKTAGSILAPGLNTISANADRGGPTKVVPKSERRGIFRLRKTVENEKCRNQLHGFIR